MDNTNNSSKTKNIAENIIKIENNFHDKTLHLQCKSEFLDKCKVISLIKHLNSTDYKDYKFNQYSIRETSEYSVVIFNYTTSNNIFSK